MVRFYGVDLTSPLLLGTAGYPSPDSLAAAVRASGAEVVTVSLRRQGPGGEGFWSLIRDLKLRVLPNTAGCHTAAEAITTARMAREVFSTSWIKLEVIGDGDLLHPDVFALVEATRVLSDDGFEVFPYTTEDLSVAERLLAVGARVLMPWGAPIGSGQGLNNPFGLKALRARFPEVPMVIDAGLGLPSHAAQAMELGFDAVLLNTAVSTAVSPALMAEAFALSVRAGRLGYLAGPMAPRDLAVPSTPVLGQAVLS